MEGNNPPAVQFGAGGEQWWQIPIGAAIYASDNVPVGTVMEIGTAYLLVGQSMIASDTFHLPMQMIAMHDPQSNIVHLTVRADTVRAMAGTPPANDPTSLQAAHYGTLPMPVSQGRTTVRETTIALREQEVVITPLPSVMKDVMVRRDAKTGSVTMTESVRGASVPAEHKDDME